MKGITYEVKIYTQDLNQDAIAARLVDIYPYGGTIVEGRGFWHGEQEHCLIITLVGDIKARVAAWHLSKWINKENDQEACLITWREIETRLVEERW